MNVHGRFRKDLIESRNGNASLDARLDALQALLDAAATSANLTVTNQNVAVNTANIATNVLSIASLLATQNKLAAGSPAIVGTGGHYATLTAALAANETNIFIKNGTYSEGNVTISNDNTIIVGESKFGVKIQVTNGQDGIRIYANGCWLSSLTIDSVTNSALACLVVGDGKATGSEDLTIGNNNTIYNCHIIGHSITFALYVAGPSYSTGSDTLDGFDAKALHSGNKVCFCSGTSTFNGDNFVMALQKYSQIFENYFSGRIAFYMTMYSACIDNIIYDSISEGVYIAAPSVNNVIRGNVIYNSTSSGIKIANQVEHTPLNAGTGAIGNVVADNVISGISSIGISIEGSENNPAIRNLITNNVIEDVDNHGIYLQDSKYNTIIANSIKNPAEDIDTYTRASGIYIVQRSTNNTIKDNYIIDLTGTAKVHTAIANREDTTCTDNIIDGNTIECNNTERTVWFQSNNTKITNNYISGGYYAGIRLDGASYCMVTNNKLYSNTRQSNNAYSEIWLQNNASYNEVSNNFVTSPANPKALNAVNVDGAGCTSNIIGSIYSSGPTNRIADTGTTTDIKDNDIAVLSLGTISDTASFIAFRAPKSSKIISVDIITKDAIVANDTDYWTIELINKGSDGSGSDVIASKTTKVTGGEGFSAYDSWNIGAMNDSYDDLSEGDVALLTFTKAASATAFAEALAVLKYRRE